MRSRLCCPCAGVLRQPERISHRQCCHASGKRIGHGSGLWYRWPTPKTPGSRQVKPISNAALPAPLAAFKSPDGVQDRRGDEGSCGSRSEGEWCRWDLVHHQGLGPGLWGAGQRRTARGASHSSDPPALRWAFRLRETHDVRSFHPGQGAAVCVLLARETTLWVRPRLVGRLSSPWLRAIHPGPEPVQAALVAVRDRAAAVARAADPHGVGGQRGGGRDAG